MGVVVGGNCQWHEQLKNAPQNPAETSVSKKGSFFVVLTTRRSRVGVVGSLWPQVWLDAGASLYGQRADVLYFQIASSHILDKYCHVSPKPSSPQLSNLNRMSTSSSQYLLIQFQGILWKASLGLVSTDEQILWLREIGNSGSLVQVLCHPRGRCRTSQWTAHQYYKESRGVLAKNQKAG